MKNLLVCLCLFVTTAIFAQEEYPEKPEVIALVKEGIALHDAQKYPEAIEKFKEALKIDKKSLVANYELGNTYYHINESDLAIKYADNVIKSKYKNSTTVAAYVMKANILDIQDKSKQALEYYEKAFEIAPNDQMLLFNMSVCEIKLGKNSAAEKHLGMSLQERPGHAGSHYMLTYISYTQESRTNAIMAASVFLICGSKNKVQLKSAEQILKKNLVSNAVQNETGGFTININAASLEKANSTCDLMLSLDILKAIDKKLDSLNIKTDTTAAGKYARILELISSCAAKVENENDNKHPKNVWSVFYGNFFKDLVESKNLEAFSNIIYSNFGDSDAQNWLKKNPESVKKYEEWLKMYRFKTDY